MSVGRMNRIEDLDGNPLWDKDNGILGNVTTSTGTESLSESLDKRVTFDQVFYSVLQSETKSYLDVAGPVDEGVALSVDELISDLKKSTLWENIQSLYVFGLQTITASTTNIKDPNKSISLINNPEHLPFSHIEANGIDSWIDTNINVSVSSDLDPLDCSVFVWPLIDEAINSTTLVDMSLRDDGAWLYVAPRRVTAGSARVFGSNHIMSFPYGFPPYRASMWGIARDNQTTYMYRKDSLVRVVEDNDPAPAPDTTITLGYSNGLFINQKYRFFVQASALTPSEVKDLHRALVRMNNSLEYFQEVSA